MATEALRELLARFEVQIDPDGNLAKGNAQVDAFRGALAQLEARLAGVKNAAAPAANALSAAFARAEAGVGRSIEAGRASSLFGSAPAQSSDGFAAAGLQRQGPQLGPTRATLDDHILNTNRQSAAFATSWRGRFQEFQTAGRAAFERVAGSAASFGERLRGGGGLQAIFSLRNALLGLGVVGAAHQIAGLVDEIGSLGERAAKLGVSVEEFQRLDVLAKQNNTSVEELGGAFRVLANNSVNPTKESTEAFRKLGVQLKDGGGALKSRNELFFESAEALADVSNENERAGLAQKVFGRGAQAILPLLASGSKGVREQRAELMKLAVVSDADAKAADKLSDSWAAATQTLRAKLSQALIQNLPLIERLSKGFFSFANSVAEFAKKINFGRAALAGLAVAFLALDTAILPVAATVAALALAFLVVEDFFTFLQGGESGTGLLLDKLFGEGGASKFRTSVLDVLEAVKELWDFVSGKGVGAKLQQLGTEFNDAANFFRDDVGNVLGAGVKLAAPVLGAVSPLAGAGAAALTDQRTQSVEVHVGSAAEVGPAVKGALNALDVDAMGNASAAVGAD